VRVGYAVPLALLCWSSAQRFFAVLGLRFRRRSVAGAWVVVGTGAALEIFDCASLLCGRIVWLRKARNTAGRPVQDDENPDPTFRRRPPCGLTILHGLRPAGHDHWNSGSLYNPGDGLTYRV
jgi:uncharacterized protein (DUF2147 family)